MIRWIALISLIGLVIFSPSVLGAQKFGVFFNYNLPLLSSQSTQVTGDAAQVQITGKVRSLPSIQLGANYKINPNYSASLAYGFSGYSSNTSIIYPLADVPTWRTDFLQQITFSYRSGIELGVQRQYEKIQLGLGLAIHTKRTESLIDNEWTYELKPVFVSYEEGYTTSYTRYRSDGGSACICGVASYSFQAYYDIHRFVSVGLRFTLMKDASRLFTLENYQQRDPRISTELGPAQKVVSVEVNEPKYSAFLSLQFRYPGRKKED